MVVRHLSEAEHPARHHHPLANRCVLGLLRSPAHHLLDPGLCELRFRGRRSGAEIALPVIYARDGDQMVVLIGDAPGKTWWRNFRTPYPVRILRGGRSRSGTGRVLRPGDADYLHAAYVYTKRHGLVPQPTDRLLVIDPAEGA
jgi:hypothetical protein